MHAVQLSQDEMGQWHTRIFQQDNFKNPNVLQLFEHSNVAVYA